MIGSVFVLYFITDLGAAFTFKYQLVVAVYETLERCEIGKELVKDRLLTVPYRSLECRPEDFIR